MRHFIFFLLLLFTFFGFSFARADLPDEPFLQSENSKLSIWKIISFEENIEENTVYATGFFVGENRFVTNFHVLLSILGRAKDNTSIALSQEGSDSVLRVKKVLALSALYDLALLETEENTTNFLSLRENPPEPSENLIIPAYPSEIFTTIKKTGNIIREDSIDYTFPVNNFLLNGASGSPVLDEQGQVVGVVYGGNVNMLSAVHIYHLEEFINRELGTECADIDRFSWSSLEACIKEEVESLQELAEQGDDLAQNELSNIYYKGEVVVQSFEKAFYWIEQAAE